MRDVLIAVPTRGQVQWQTATALEAARDYMGEGTPAILYQEAQLSVAMARNRVVKRFMETDCQVLAMVDDDIAPPINFVEMMLPYLGEYAMVSLPHAWQHQHDPSVLLFSTFDQVEDGLKPKGLWTGINEVDAVATGCVLIGRPALEELGHAPFRVSHDPDDAIQSDDFLFCRDLRAAGFKIGAYWEGRFVDHFRQVTLAPLADAYLNTRSVL